MVLYLSRMALNPRSREARRDVADCYELHRTVMAMFPKSSDSAEGSPRALYRLEAEGRHAIAPSVTIQSGVEPDWDRLPAGYLLGVGARPESKRIDQLLSHLDRYPALAFLLIANPTRKLRITTSGVDGLKPMRVEIRDDQTLMDWLRRKGREGGFEPLEVRAAPSAGVPIYEVMATSGKRAGVQRRKGAHNRLTFGAVRFEGRLRVTDSAAFTQTVTQGVGSAKAFGFGLLSVAPGR